MTSAAGPSKTTLNPYQPFPTTQTKNERLRFSSAHPFTPAFVESRLSKAKNLDIRKSLYDSRVKGRSILLENPVRNSGLKKEREEKKARKTKEHERRKRKLIGRKEADSKGLWNLEEDQKKYELFIPLHHLWLGYMSELLCLSQAPASQPTNPTMPNSAAMHGKLVKADFHGSVIAVKEAKNPCLVGLSGIVIHETENAFKVITIKNQVKLIPKQGAIFSFRIPIYDVRALVSHSVPKLDSAASSSEWLDLDTIPRMEFELYGNQFRFRAADRAGRKFKAKETIEL
ncbi:hypothetical protein EW145_g5654 [Phellinidium pouzarii]|uniref:Ribonuclease P protein subunit n=1 Tax=Phellinidium pouzarii TaxID=167371 RepID=A0A4S4KZU5_9AGAM|nr:hypothetical protein EW145_g5654 [Phellinidium pouzarii]